MTWEPLPPRARLLFYLQAFTRLILFWAPACAALFVGLWSVWTLVGAASVAVALFGLRVLIAAALPALAHAHWAYASRPDDLLVAHGVLFRTITAIPAMRIQHVDVRQGPLERLLGLARVQIYTASGMGADGVIPGLELEAAEALRDRLVAIEGDDGV